MPDFFSIKQEIRDLVDDADGNYTTDAYLTTKVNIVYRDLFNKLRGSGAQFDQQVPELFAVKAGTRDLGAYFQTGKPLALLLNPQVLEWKLANTDPINYREAKITSRLRDVQASQSISAWEWRAGNIYFNPATIDVDLRVRGEFLAAPLLQDSDTVSIGSNIQSAIVYMTSSLIGSVRGNQAWEKTYMFKADDALDDILSMLTKADQAKIRRVGRMSRRNQARPLRGPIT